MLLMPFYYPAFRTMSAAGFLGNWPRPMHLGGDAQSSGVTSCDRTPSCKVNTVVVFRYLFFFARIVVFTLLIPPPSSALNSPSIVNKIYTTFTSDFSRKFRTMARTLIVKTVEDIPSPIEDVWAILQAFGAIKTWMPTIESCKVEGEGVGAVRTVSTGGNSIQEKLEVFDHKKHLVSYRLVDPTGMPMKGGFGTVSLTADGDNNTKITWVSDAEEVEGSNIQIIARVFESFIKKSIRGLTEVLGRAAEPIF